MPQGFCSKHKGIVEEDTVMDTKMREELSANIRRGFFYILKAINLNPTYKLLTDVVLRQTITFFSKLIKQTTQLQPFIMRTLL